MFLIVSVHQRLLRPDKLVFLITPIVFLWYYVGRSIDVPSKYVFLSLFLLLHQLASSSAFAIYPIFYVSGTKVKLICVPYDKTHYFGSPH